MIHRTFHTTDLSIQVGGKWSLQVSQYDSFDVTFDHDATYDVAVGRLRDATTGDLLTVNGETGPQVDLVEVENTVVATVSGLTRTMVYELAVTFTEADTDTETQTLPIECVA